MPNIFPPKVTIFSSAVELGKRLAFSGMFSVSDLDPLTTITRYRFRDNGGAATSGFFVQNGVRKAANVWFEIDASQLASVFYQSALIISSESITVEAFDGQFWSAPAVGSVYSVVPNIRAPNVTARDTSILSTETLVVDSLVSAADLDGYPITKYMFVDRSFGTGGGYFAIGGVQKASGVWFSVNAADLHLLRYIGGLNAGSENIGIQAFDGAKWSPTVDVVWTTTPDNFAPTVEAFDLKIPVSRVISADQLFKFTDIDGNTIKKVQFFDTGVLPTGGFFTVNGVVQAPNAWFEVDRPQFAQVEYHTAANFDFERFRVRAFDGKFWSTIASAKIISVTPPDIIVPRVLILDAFEERLASTIISFGPGPLITKYEIIDLSEGASTAKILKNGIELEEGIVHALTPTQFTSLSFKGGVDDRGREFDNFVVRAFNGVFWSQWTNINVHTDAFAEVALDARTDWSPGGAPIVLEYTFLLAIPGYYSTDSAEYTGGPGPLNATQRATIRKALATFETMLNIDFVEVPQSISPLGDIILGDITFGLTTEPDGVAAHAYFPSGPGLPGDVWFDREYFNAEQSSADGLAVVFHEMGHALGLTHTFQEGPTDFTNLPPATENDRFSMMSYTNADGLGRRNESPMLYDLRELQKDYGANLNYNADDTDIRLTPNYSAFKVIWDGGGIDTLNLNNQTTSIIADLREGRYSSLGGVSQNVAIGYGAVIENLRSGIGNDELFGNELNNIITGNAGNDEITGFSGNDTFRGGAGNDHYFYTLGDDFDVIDEEALAGRDVLTIRGFGTFDSLTEDLSFRVLHGRDLDIQLTLDGGETQGGIVIRNMAWGGSRIETLEIQDSMGLSIGADIDLKSIFVYSTTELRKFRETEFTTQFGTLAVPV